MKALWEGLSGPGVWSTEPVPVDFQGMMSSLTKPGFYLWRHHLRFQPAVISETT
jgi:hypothetical protein